MTSKDDTSISCFIGLNSFDINHHDDDEKDNNSNHKYKLSDINQINLPLKQSDKYNNSHNNNLNKIYVRLFGNSNYFYPIVNNDEILSILRNKISWKNYGIKIVGSNQWNVEKQTGLRFIKFISHSQSKINNKSKFLSLNIYIHIKSGINNNLQYCNLKKTSIMLSYNVKQTIIECVQQSMIKLKNDNLNNYFLSKYEISSFDMILRDIPGISQSIANIIINANQRSPSRKKFCKIFLKQIGMNIDMDIDNISQDVLSNQIHQHLLYHCVTDQQWFEFGINTKQIIIDKHGKQLKNEQKSLFEITLKDVNTLANRVYRSCSQNK